MSRTASISVAAAFLLALAEGAAAQDGGVLLLDDVSIKGEVRQPAVAIISSRMQPEIAGFRLEKSFFDQVRSPDEELVDLDRALGGHEPVRDRDGLLERARILPQGSWPLKGGPAAADQPKAAAEGERGQ